MARWETKWRRTVRKTRVPGVWELKSGGYLVRARRRLPGGKSKEIQRVVRDARSADEARQKLLVLTQEVTAASTRGSSPLFAEYAASVLERRIKSRRIKSPATVRKWQETLEYQLVPFFGDSAIDRIEHRHVLHWIATLENKVHAGEYAARTVNTWIRVLKTICKTAAPAFKFADPTQGVSQLPEVDRTYTVESPNALPPERVGAFMRKVEELYPHHYAMALLMLVTGLRPSSIRPLRRKGPHRDYCADSGTLLVRRSQVLGMPMEYTKTNRDQTIALPKSLRVILDEHVRSLDEAEGPMAESDLLFPGEHGGYRARSVLDRPLEKVAKAVGIPFRVTPKAFRRTFKNFSRRNKVSRVVERSVSGHLTEEMDHVYGFAFVDEQREVLEGILEEAGVGSRVARPCERGAERCTGGGTAACAGQKCVMAVCDQPALACSLGAGAGLRARSHGSTGGSQGRAIEEEKQEARGA